MSEEKLREALETLKEEFTKHRTYAAQTSFDEAQVVLCNFAINGIEQALSEAGEEPEMLRLLRWLDNARQINKERAEGFKAKLPKSALMFGGMAAAYNHTIEEIEREFGYKLPKGRSDE